jgi:hypothetical protein
VKTCAYVTITGGTMESYVEIGIYSTFVPSDKLMGKIAAIYIRAYYFSLLTYFQQPVLFC